MQIENDYRDRALGRIVIDHSAFHRSGNIINEVRTSAHVTLEMEFNFNTKSG